MRKLIPSAAAAVALGVASLALSALSEASIIVVANYKLGEVDPGAVPGNGGNASTVDLSGNGYDLTSKIGSPTYSSEHVSGIGSSISMSFDGRSYYSGPTVSNDTENFGISLFVKPSEVSRTQAIAINGSGCCSGFGIFLQDGLYYGLYGGVNVIEIGAASTDAWAYLALVNTGGVTTAYYNLIATNSGFFGDPHPADGPVCCNPPLHMTIGSDGSNHFRGLVDEVQVFTFAPGAFNPNDLIRVPEPASISLLGLGLAGLVVARRANRQKNN